MKHVGKGADIDSLRHPFAHWTSSDAAELRDVVRAASDAVTALADRLNTLALRVALIGGVNEADGTASNVEVYLNRLALLVDSAGEQMHRVQKLIRVLEIATIQTEVNSRITSDGGEQAK